jgi:hypothetical protein
MRLEDLQPNASVRGILLDGAVSRDDRARGAHPGDAAGTGARAAGARRSVEAHRVRPADGRRALVPTTATSALMPARPGEATTATISVLRHIISLNSNVAAGAGSAQEQWLRTDLEAAITAPCTLAYWHHPRFSSGANHGNDARTDALFRALYEYGTDVVITGHDHIYERFAPQDPNAQADPTGIREFVVGTGGAGLYGIGTIRANSEVRRGAPNGAHGVLKLILKEGNYDWEFIPIAAETFRDTGNAACLKGSVQLPN